MSPEDNELMCLVEGDAPMGKIMRAHWMPVCMSEEVAERDGPPVRARLLGEDLVAFRDSNGRVGVLAEACPHRGASLFFGRNEEGGLRCLYHGWKFDTEGHVLDMACEPNAERMCAGMRHRHYPVHEAGGFVWAWMGDPAQAAPFQTPAWAPTPDTKISIVKMHVACNWAQVLEGSIDSAHSSSLHSTNIPAADGIGGSTATGDTWARPTVDKAPRMEYELTDYGFRYVALRRPIVREESEVYVRMTIFVAPFTVLIPPNNQYHLSQMLIPMDDGNCMFYWVAWHETKGIEQDEWRRFCAALPGVDLDSDFRKLRNAGNNYMQDREAMKRGDFTGIKGIPTQDMAMWESMGRIADRTADKLGASDMAIIQFRKQMIAAAKKVRDGGPAIGATEPRTEPVTLRSYEGVIPKSLDWKSLDFEAFEANRIRPEAA